MNKIFTQIIFLIAATNYFLIAQSNDLTKNKSIQIDSIQITGNKTTEEFIILRELDFTVGDNVSEKQLDFNRERIFSLGIFNKVDFNLNEEESLNILEIRIEESWYIYPLPYLRLRENSFKRSTYGLGVLYKNFRGRNENLWGLVTFGYDPTFMLTYYTPMLKTGTNLTFGIDVGYTHLANRNIASEKIYGDQFSYNYIYGSVALGYRLNQYNNIYLGTMYEFIDMPEQISQLSASKSRIDRIFSMGIFYELDNRNLKQFSDNGTFLESSIIHKGFGINNISYNIFNIDIRKYNTIYGNLAAKWRGLFRSTFGGSIPFYGLSLLGDEEYIRGHRFDKREGNNYLITSLEVNYPIIKEWNLSLDLPLLPKSLTSARIGLYTNLFVDSGTTFDNNESLKLNSADTGWGFGLTLLVLPYNAIRFEYAFNEMKKGEFILETGFSF
ncbi:MAG: hypothetical protein H6610_07770 [Ignavibacteriales bacterium]|nr:hypothetical protein [Ignavibacteriales bacterium]